MCDGGPATVVNTRTHLQFPVFFFNKTHRKPKCYIEWLTNILFFRIIIISFEISSGRFAFANYLISLDFAPTM